MKAAHRCKAPRLLLQIKKARARSFGVIHKGDGLPELERSRITTWLYRSTISRLPSCTWCMSVQPQRSPVLKAEAKRSTLLWCGSKFCERSRLPKRMLGCLFIHIVLRFVWRNFLDAYNQTVEAQNANLPARISHRVFGCFRSGCRAAIKRSRNSQHRNRFDSRDVGRRSNQETRGVRSQPSKNGTTQGITR